MEGVAVVMANDNRLLLIPVPVFYRLWGKHRQWTRRATSRARVGVDEGWPGSISLGVRLAMARIGLSGVFIGTL